MRASELLGRTVIDADGYPVGVVSGLLATCDGPNSGHPAAPRINGLYVSPRHVGSYLGYQQPDQRGPWLVRVLVNLLQRDTRYIAWEDVNDYQEEPMRLVATSVSARLRREPPQ